jgi:hypothetical protein
MTRLQGLEDFKNDLEKLRNFLNKCGHDAPINLIDPDQELYEFGVAVCEALAWINTKIEAEEEAGAEAIDDNENLYRVGQ